MGQSYALILHQAERAAFRCGAKWIVLGFADECFVYLLVANAIDVCFHTCFLVQYFQHCFGRITVALGVWGVVTKHFQF